MLKELFLDLETTGLDSSKNGITQIAGILLADGEEVNRFNFDVAPFEDKIVEASALNVAGKTIEEIIGSNELSPAVRNNGGGVLNNAFILAQSLIDSEKQVLITSEKTNSHQIYLT